MKHHTVTGGGGVRLHLVETGNPRGQAIVFLHGFSQCWLAWTRQLESDLASDFRLIAMDLRGHGLSDRPKDGYDNAKLWAADVDSVIGELDLDRPILSGWSYGPLVILDYIRHHGDEAIGGIHFVAALTKLGSEAAIAALSPTFLALVPGFFSDNAVESVGSLDSLLRLCFAEPPAAADHYTMLGYNVAVPPFVRQALLSRTFDNDDILPTITKPVLITHGARDAIVKPEIVEQHCTAIAHANVQIMPDAGHAPFWDCATSFNRRLATFAADVAGSESRTTGAVITARGSDA